MVRGKNRANVEFGSKINISEVEGFVRCDHLGWDNYDEGGDLKEHNIRIVGKPLGRPPKQKLSGYRKYKTRKEQNMRNHVKGKFGQGKNGYNLNRIRAKRQDTSESWISAILFVMNLTKLMKVAVQYGYFLAHSLWRHIRMITRSVDMKYYILSPSMKITAV